MGHYFIIVSRFSNTKYKIMFCFILAGTSLFSLQHGQAKKLPLLSIDGTTEEFSKICLLRPGTRDLLLIRAPPSMSVAPAIGEQCFMGLWAMLHGT